MHAYIEPPIAGDALFHCRAGGFPTTLLDANGNDPTSKRRAVIRRFPAAVGRCTAEVPS